MRLIVTVLSIGAIYSYGYALAGLGGFLVGRGNTGYIIWGVLGGTAAAAAALVLWRKNLNSFYANDADITPEELKNAKITLPEKLLKRN